MKIKLVALGIIIALNSTSTLASLTPTVSAGTVVENETLNDPDITQYVYGTVINSVINGSDQKIVAGGAVSGMNNQGGVQTVDYSGSISESFLNSHDASLFLSGNASNVSVNAGTMDILEGGIATDTVVTGGDSVLNNRFGTDTGTLVSAGGVLNTGSLTESGQINSAHSFNTVVKEGGTQNVQNGGTSEGSIIEKGGTLTVQANYHTEDTGIGTISGIANDSIVYGRMNNHGGVDNNTVIKDGGLYQLGYGKATDDQGGYISSSNNLLVEQGGYANLSGYSTINNMTVAGSATSYDQASLYDTVVDSTGTLTVDDSSYANNITNDGTLILKAAGLIEPTITGDVVTNAGATTTVWAHADTSGADFMVAGDLILTGEHDRNHDPDAQSLTKPQTYQFTSLDLQGGRVYLDLDNYSELITDTLSGNGDFYINTSIGERKNSAITITGTDSGSFNVYANDTGVSPANDEALRIVTATGGSAEFILANEGGVVDAGTYEYHLVADGTGNWDLATLADAGSEDPVDPVDPVDPTPPEPDTPSDETEPATPTYTPSTSAVLAMAVTSPIINDVEMHTVRDRIDAVRDVSHDLNLWIRYLGSQQNVDNDATRFDLNLNGVIVGTDATRELENSHLTMGGFVGYTHSDVDFDRGGEGDVDSWTTGAYLSWMNNRGYYADSIVKVNRFSDDVNARMTSGGKADGDYNQNGISAHLEAGKYFTFDQAFVAPYVGITGFTTNGSDYKLSNGMKADVDNIQSLVAETGVNIGTTYQVRSVELKPYMKLAVADEMVSGNDVRVNNDTLEDDMSGVIGIYEAGLNSQITDNLNAGFSVQYNHSDKMESPYIVNAGVSLKF